MASKINLVVRLQHWMDSVPGQTFLNYAYSWGAAIVILGALFKLTHLPGGNLMLFIGMGTEVVVFFLSAFDRPFDKKRTELAEDYQTDEEIEASLEEEETTDEEKETAETPHAEGGGTVIIGNIQGGTGVTSGSAIPTANAGGVSGVVQLGAGSLVANAQSSLTPEMEDAVQQYVEELKRLTETLSKVEAQSAKLTQDSEEMVNLNRTLTGINTVYELQLKSVSSQIGTIDQINDQTRRMAAQIEELNAVYSRMIKALTVNMKNAQGTTES